MKSKIHEVKKLNKIMSKKAIILVAFVLSSFAVQAQELKWETDINKAISVSNKSKKPY